MLKNMVILKCGCDPQTNYECGGMIKGQCEYCHYAPATTISVCLCESRHEIPEAINGSIFPQEVDPMDFKGLYDHVESVLGKISVECVHLYVTGCTPALIETINWCHDNGVKLVLWHYNRDTGKYQTSGEVR